LACKYLNYLTLQRTASDLTIKSYANDLSQFLRPLGVQKILYTPSAASESFQIKWIETPRQVTDLTEQCVTLLHDANELWKNLQPASRSRKLAAVRGWFKWLHAQKLISRDLSLRVIAPKVPHKIPHFLSVDEALSVVRAVNAETTPPERRALVLLLYGGGLRVSEACSVRWQDMVEKERSLRVKGKGSKERLICLPALVWQALNRLPRTGPYVFGGKDSLSTRKAYLWVRDAGVRAGLMKSLHPHALRHSYATHLLTSGADLRVLQELLGHSSLAATQRYTHLSLDHLARTLENHHPLSASKLKVGGDVG
jgi:integrase/recombinase XerC/integrase/recombinase XerD